MTNNRFAALDALRGICACMVALYHFHTIGWINNSPLIQHAALFVDFFFVLSGFVIAASYGDKLADGYSPAKFIGLRIGRIYPLHLAALAVLVIAELGFAFLAPHMADRVPFTGKNSPTDILYNVGLIQIFAGEPLSWNMPSWSIAAEFWTYVTFALLWRVAGARAWLFAIPIAIVGLALLAIFPEQHLLVFHAWSIVRCIVGFGLGVVAYKIYRDGPEHLSERMGTAVEAGISLAILAFVSFSSGLWMLATPALFAVAVLVFSFEKGSVSRALRWRPLQLVGELSYSIYMLHYFVQLRMVNGLSLVERLTHHRVSLVSHIAGVNGVGHSAAFSDLMSLAMLAVLIPIAWLGFNLVERPGREWSRQLILGPKRAEPTTIGTVAF